MATWFTADLHLGHPKIIEYCDRPFADVDVMNRTIMNNWNETVAEDDTIWVVGDFALGKIAETLPLIAELSGYKILLTGNHDRCWAGHERRAEGWTEKYLNAGFNEVRHGSAKFKISKRNVIACHFPYRGDSQDKDRFIKHRPVDKGAWLLNGHVHEKWAQRGRMINVGVDANDFRPISEYSIAKLITLGPKNRSTLNDPALVH